MTYDLDTARRHKRYVCDGPRVTVDSALADDQHPNTLPSQYYKVAPRRGNPELVVLRATKPLIEVDFIHFGPTGADQRLRPAKGPARITPGVYSGA
jgi:hypothetical protein